MFLWGIALLNIVEQQPCFLELRLYCSTKSWLSHADFQVSSSLRNVVVTTLSTFREAIPASARGVLVSELGFLIVTLGDKFRGCKRKLYCLSAVCQGECTWDCSVAQCSLEFLGTAQQCPKRFVFCSFLRKGSCSFIVIVSCGLVMVSSEPGFSHLQVVTFYSSLQQCFEVIAARGVTLQS